MKKIIKIAIPVVIIIGCVSAFLVHRHRVKMYNEQIQLEILYKHQNDALGMYRVKHADLIYFHGVDELDPAYLLIATTVYNSDQEKYQLSVEEIVTFLSSEYDEEGRLRVYNKPEDLDDYILWYWNGGAAKIEDYYGIIDRYLSEINYPENICEISDEKLYEVVQQYQAEYGLYSSEEDDTKKIIPKGDLEVSEVYEISQEIVKEYGNDATPEEIEEVVNRYKEEKQKSVSD